MDNKEIVFINSHPIQYFAPLYKYMNEQGLTTQAWYCSDEPLKGSFDKQFGTQVKWDIPLLDGYEYIFFKNYSPKPSHFKGFFGLINLGMIKRVFTIPKSIIIVHGWHYFTHFFILLLGKLKGHTVCVRCDIPENQEKLKTGFKQKIKRIGLRYLLFPRINYFLFVGSQNKLFYQSYSLPDRKLIFCPYAVDNYRFSDEYNFLKNETSYFKQQRSIPETDKIILFIAKYIEKKRPLDLLQAFKEVNNKNCWLFFVGEGELRKEMETYISQHKLTRVILTGFVNQSKISEYYAMSDVFVMCSGEGENWGLSVNEAMNFDLPLVVSDLTGCADDLVKDGVNGFIYKTGNVDELKLKLEAVLNGKLTWEKSSKNIVDEYSFQTIVSSLKTIVYND